MEILPSTIRKQILEEHDVIRLKLDALERSLKNLGADSSTDTVEIIRSARALKDFFLRHLALEERILRPLLLTVDAWGECRTDSMDKEHHLQRQMFEEFDQLVSTWPKDRVQAALGTLIKNLRVDMQEEEKAALHPNLLRDDVVTIISDSED
jgi:hemerythrin-like domain-containing protein